MVSIDNLRIREFHSRLLELNGGTWFNFEPHLSAFYRAILKPGAIAVDGGANIGLHTLQMAEAVRPDGLVIAIEPVPETREKLKLRQREAQIPAELIRLLAYGLSIEAGETEFFQVVDPIQHELSGLRNRDFLENHQVKKIRIELTTLDAVCRDLNRLDFIKLDLEGAELDALRAGRSTLKRFRPVIALEQSQDGPRYFGYTWGDLLCYFATLRYEVYDLFGQRYTDASMLDACAVWDFVGIPAEYAGKDALFTAVRRSMQLKGLVPPDAGISQQMTREEAPSLYSLDRIGTVIEPASQESVHVPGDRHIEFSGWALCANGDGLTDQHRRTPAGGVDIAIEDTLFYAVYGEDREDVANHFQNPDYRRSGFRLVLLPGMLTKGEHTMSMRVISPDQTSYYQGQSVTFTVD